MDGEDERHVLALAEFEGKLPPILVHRPTMRVIDGMHRLRAVQLRGQDKIDVHFFDGDTESAFVLAVRVNTAHGLPLTLADRRAAAARIFASKPQWSDRAIASVTGLSAKTVRTLRGRSTEENPQLNARVGRDGRVRPLSSVEGRLAASKMMQEQPTASLREIAKVIGISIGTARDVRERLRRGDDPVRPRQRQAVENGLTPRGNLNERACPSKRVSEQTNLVNHLQTMQQLRRDPSLRLNDDGRIVLRWLDAHVINLNEWADLVGKIPSHCKIVIADLARSVANVWCEFAKELVDQGDGIVGEQGGGSAHQREVVD
ncbi:MAG: ParB/RepB/Spo0J family partition protein [Actinomycetota bacterium]|nr:ParB/RepB/Spo0J family partition protein [Actinomycetota bacterium]